METSTSDGAVADRHGFADRPSFADRHSGPDPADRNPVRSCPSPGALAEVPA